MKAPYLHKNGCLVSVAAFQVWEAGDRHLDVQLTPYFHRQPFLLLGSEEGAEEPRIIPQVSLGEPVQGSHAVQGPLLAQEKRRSLGVFLKQKSQDVNIKSQQTGRAFPGLRGRAGLTATSAAPAFTCVRRGAGGSRLLGLSAERLRALPKGSPQDGRPVLGRGCAGPSAADSITGPAPLPAGRLLNALPVSPRGALGGMPPQPPYLRRAEVREGERLWCRVPCEWPVCRGSA